MSVRRMLAVMAALMAMVIAGSGSSAMAAAGNNGTVKVDGTTIFKQMNANEPHVGCDFSIEWYGFDASNTTSYVTFNTQSPTSNRNLILNDPVMLDGDDSSGGGSPAGFDGSKLYTLQFDPNLDYLHPNQGYHIKVTVETPTANGSDLKYKTFWVQGCETPPPPL